MGKDQFIKGGRGGFQRRVGKSKLLTNFEILGVDSTYRLVTYFWNKAQISVAAGFSLRYAVNNLQFFHNLKAAATRSKHNCHNLSLAHRA